MLVLSSEIGRWDQLVAIDCSKGPGYSAASWGSPHTRSANPAHRSIACSIFSLAAFFLQPTLTFKLHDCELFFLSSVSAAESLRSTCGAERGAPDCSKQPFPEATPHVGQGTERTIFGARSFFFIGVRCAKKCCKAVRIETF